MLRSELFTTAPMARNPVKEIVNRNRKGTSGWRLVPPILLCILQNVKIFFTSFVLRCAI